MLTQETSRHAARLQKSGRLRRVLDVLKDGFKHSTMAIQAHAQVCAPGTCVSELRANGYNIECKRSKGRFWYQLITQKEPTDE